MLPSRTPTSTMEFNPPWWLSGGHTQTLWRKFSPTSSIDHWRERIELRDGDFIDLDWSVGIRSSSAAAGKIVLILHGLCGCSRSSYVLSLQNSLDNRGISSVAMNLRGCSGESNRLARSYHSGISADVQEVMSVLSQRLPASRFFIVGYSLGANVLLKWLGEQGSSAAVSRAVAVSTPFELAACSNALLRGVSRFYGAHFVRRLRQDLRGKRYQMSRDYAEEAQRIDALGPLDQIRTIREFDERVTAPLNGFCDADDYYSRCSSRQFLPAITVDTLLLQSADDPLIPVSAIPTAAELPENVRLDLHSRGGHVGFYTGARSDWLDQRILDFIEVD